MSTDLYMTCDISVRLTKRVEAAGSRPSIGTRASTVVATIVTVEALEKSAADNRSCKEKYSALTRYRLRRLSIKEMHHEMVW